MSETSDALLELLVGKLKDDTKKFAEEQIVQMKEEINKNLTEVKKISEDMIKQSKEIVANCGHIANLGTIEKPEFEMTHSSFDKILKVLSSAKRKEKNIMLVGGAGGGKTHLVKQIAQALKLDFYPMSVGLQTTKSDLLGFINATGTYMPSIIRKAFENGGVLLLDEFDAAHAGVVTILNSLLANGHASFPDKVVDKNKDFICIVACNTFGTGANMEYVGRNRLDGATLDRFITIDIDYDEELEKGLTKNDNWFSIIQKIRENAKKQGIKQIISPRASMDGADLLDIGFSIQDALKMVVFKGCSEEVSKKLIEGIDLSVTEPEQRKRHRRTREEMEEARQNEKFDYILEIDTSKPEIEQMKILKCSSIMDNCFDSIANKYFGDYCVRFTSGAGFRYGFSDNNFWFPKTQENCQKPFFGGITSKEKEKLKKLLNELGSVSFPFKFRVILDGEKFSYGV